MLQSIQRSYMVVLIVALAAGIGLSGCTDTLVSAEAPDAVVAREAVQPAPAQEPVEIEWQGRIMERWNTPTTPPDTTSVPTLPPSLPGSR